jgi:PEGA domain-containing protein
MKSRAHLFLAGVALFALSAGACAHGLGDNAIALRVECNVPDATLWVDDVLVGKVTDWKSDGKHIRAGFHRIEVRHPNYYSFFQEVELPGGNSVVVKAKLRELIE